MSEAELVVDGHELTNCIATGNVSQVWEATNTATGQSVAMKLLLPEALTDADHKRMFKHEVSVIKQLEHPNIIRYIDSTLNKKQHYYTMELFRSSNLKSLIRADLHSVHLRLRKLMECCAQAFGYMHEKGWIHKDIKPDNILMTKGSEVRVIDFSLASKGSSSMGHMMTRKKNIVIQGTRTYIAPELIRREKLTPAADIYSLGILFYETLTGRPPFMAGNPNELLMMHVRDQPDLPSSYHPNIHPEADALVMKMLSKKVKDRHESMQQVFSEVRSVKLFRQEPEEFKKAKMAKTAEEQATTVDQRLDSRADHQRTSSGAPAPPKPAPAKPKPATPAAEKPAAATPPSRAPQAAPPVPAAQHQPMMPQQPMQYPPMQQPYMPQYPGAQYPMQPGMMPPGQYPQMPAGQFPPGMPGQYPQMPPQPGGQYPGQPVSPPQQAPAQQPPSSAPQKPAAPPPSPKEDHDKPDGIDWINIS
ncbi:MAG: serine/threonine-protein kinase [Planctomycetaceae bacterium]